MQNLILDIVEKKTGRTIMPDQELMGSGILDSVTLVEIIIDLESAYQISVPPVHVTKENFQSVNAICRYIESRMNA